jgi:hypothetical protein
MARQLLAVRTGGCARMRKGSQMSHCGSPDRWNIETPVGKAGLELEIEFLLIMPERVTLTHPSPFLFTTTISSPPLRVPTL